MLSPSSAKSCLTTATVFVNGATSVAITTIGRDLSFEESDLQWPLNVFSLSFGCLLLFFGRVSDIIGNRKIFLFGSAWFAIWSLAASFAQSSESLIVFYALQVQMLTRSRTAANMPAGISIISAYFPPGRSKNVAFAVLGAGQPLGFIVGMIVGGLLCQSQGSWRSVFWLQSGLAGMFVILGFFVLPKGDPSKKYTKGLDWIGALLSTAGLGLLTYDLAESTSTPRGRMTPFVPCLLATSIVIMVLFVFWEIRCEGRGQAVLVPMSIWSQPGAKMGPIIACIIFAWWAFNTLSYFSALFYQQVLLLSPIQTVLRLLPIGISGLITDLLTGYLVGAFPGRILIPFGIMSCIISSTIFALINVHASYWSMAFIAMITLPVLEVAYTVANMHVCFAFDVDSQALAGGIFSVATRLGTSLGLAISSSIATTISENYNRAHPELAATDPSVLLGGFRAAGWTCCGAATIALLIALFGLRDIGVVGQRTHSSMVENTGGQDLLKSNSAHQSEPSVTLESTSGSSVILKNAPESEGPEKHLWQAALDRIVEVS
ncbi:MFS general substrate transporter [Obba rivulosa]|uniref:MFS general substrate transporter n=1 Tax=Obba rivulosa TaxID=1052685 RepID=A0A8E2DKV0_9APHY|nr:MFS general substrate transporter [Obba rivulosa]